MKSSFRYFLFLLMLPLLSYSQKGMTTVGVQIKPIFPFQFQGTSKIVTNEGNVRFETGLSSGFSSGLVIRHNITKLLAFETGINYLKRKYFFNITDGDFVGETSFRIISYEIPFVLMIYSQIGEKMYLNGSMGPSLDMFASHIQTFDTYYNHVAFRNHVFQPAISANLGTEYRTDKSGIIYLGISYHRPFQYIYLSKAGYYRDNKNLVIADEISGSYITIDFRYFFPEGNTKKITDDSY